MWLPLTLLVLVGAVAADYEHGWKAGTEYNYLVRSRTLTGLDELSDQYSGIHIKALLTVQRKDSDTLRAKVSKAQYANVHTKLPGGWDSQISDRMLDLRELPISGKPFEIKIKHGVIRDLIVDREVPTWEVNVLKSIVGQLQVDTQGENARRSSSTQVPTDEEPYGMFKAMEDSVGGKCEVLYDITPLQEYIYHSKPELVPMPHLKEDGQHIDIVKTKNFSRCEQRMHYHFGITGNSKWEPRSDQDAEFFSKSSTSRIVITGNLKRFTIQSSVTTSKMFIKPQINAQEKGMVVSRVNLTLASMNKISSHLDAPNNPESTGNLVYVYNNPFSDSDNRKPSRSGDSENSREKSDSKNAGSSEEDKRNNRNREDGSSSINSNEERDFWQPKPTLEEPPQNPLLPNFIGYKGKAISKSKEIDPVRSTKDLVEEIANDLDDPSNLPEKDTLEKFSILTNLIRTMNRKQIQEAVNNMHLSENELKSNEKSQSKKQNAWAVIRDAVSQAGTGPALLIIKDWIERKKIDSSEAVDLVSRIPKTARAPTAEYVKAVFELATNPEVMRTRDVNAASILAFAELVRKSQIDKNAIHNHYPVHAFGRLTSKNDQTVLEEYIPFLAKELKDAVKEGSSTKIQTYIMALGGIGHPKILSVFEPYLEGDVPMTAFQRTLMVLSMGRLAEMNPKLARSVLYKIYLNTMEVHEVRCAAVLLLLGTDPPLSMLQRMAEFTNYDTNRQVNSAVKSMIESLAELKDPESQDLANKARAAKNLLNRREDDYQCSHAYVANGVDDKNNIAHKLILSYIGSDDSPIPRAFYTRIQTGLSHFNTYTFELGGMVSSVKDLYEMYQNRRSKDKSGKSPTEKIAEALNIKSEDPAKFEANFLWDSMVSSQFIAYDEQNIDWIPDMIVENLKSLKEGRYTNMNKMFSTDVVLSFPTETGLPFLYTHKMPSLCKMSTESRVEIGDTDHASGRSEVRLVIAKKVQGAIGFVAPFEHRHYIAGVDKNYQIYAPLKLQVDVDTQKKSLELKVWPLKGELNARLLHVSTVPYTARRDVLNLRPVLSDKNTHKVHTREPQAITQSIPSENVKAFRFEMEGDDLDNGKNGKKSDNPFARFNFFSDRYFKSDMFMNLEQEQREPVVFTVAIDSMQADPNSEDRENWSPKPKAVKASSKESNSNDRRKQFLKEAAKGMKLASSQVVDLSLKTPGELRSNNVLTVAWANSAAEEKTRTLFYWSGSLPNQEINQEVCAAAQVTATPNPLLDFEKAINSKPKVDFGVDIRYGRDCFDEGQISINGDASQSKGLRNKIRESRAAKKCEEQMKEGNKGLRACQKATAAAMTLDEMQMSMDLHSKPIQTMANMAVHTFKDMEFAKTHVNALNPVNAEKEKIDIRAKLSDNLDKATITVHTSVMDVTFPDIDVPEFAVDGLDIERANDNMALRDSSDNEQERSCVLDKSQVETFDSRSYPLRLGNCWHVIMTTYPKKNPENTNEKLRIPEEMRASVVARETENGQKEVKIALGETEIRLSASGSRPEANVDGKKILTSEDTYQEKRNNEVEFQIFRLTDNSIALKSSKYDVEAVYDGKRVLIKASDKYRNSVRGLCGNFNGEKEDDFTGPKNCILKSVDEFTATYALTKEQCQGPALENARRSHKFECTPKLHRMSDVINDREAGRSTNDNRGWGYHQGDRRDEKQCNTHRTKVAMVDDKVCFSIRPVPSCDNSCSPIQTKTKNYQFHCMPKSPAALEMKKRVEKGANPDLSQKTPSLSQPIEVPLGCRA